MQQPYVDTTEVTAEVRNHYDVGKGLMQWHQHCITRRVFERDPSLERFNIDGCEFIPWFSQQDCADILSVAKPYEREVSSDGGYDLVYSLPDSEEGFIVNLLSRLFTTEVDQRIFNFFGSEYMVYSFKLLRTINGMPTNISHLWHRDCSPTFHMKLFIYLNDYDDHKGGTHCIPMQHTYEIAKAGYSFPTTRGRIADLRHYCDAAQVPHPKLHQFRTGELALFRPLECLHRAVAPSGSEDRKIIAIRLMPSNLPWMQALKLWPLSLAQKNHGLDFTDLFTQVLQKKCTVAVES